MPIKILIVDDDKTIRKVVGRSLKDYLCEVLEAADGVEGLALAQHDRPDLILLDYNMPGMDGAKMLARLKADAELRTIPVLMLTSEASRETVVRIARLGVRGYVVKPFHAAELLARIGLLTKLEPRNALDGQSKRFDEALQILVVDDKPVICDQIQEALSTTNWKVQGVAQANQALEACHQTTPDLILISLSLPENGAFTLFQSLRSMGRTRTVPILGLSVKTATDEQARAQQLGFNGVVTKPIDIAALESKITRALNLDISAKYFHVSDGLLTLTLPANFNAAAAAEISAHLRLKVCEAVDAGLNRFIMDLSKLESVDVTLMKMGLQVIQLCTELEMRYALLGSEPVRRECANYAETKDWQFSGSLSEALATFDGKTSVNA